MMLLSVRIRWVACICLATVASAPRTSLAREPYAEFLQGLQQRGYGEQAVDYLRSIADKSDLPDELREMWDLEMAESLQLAAREAATAALATQWQAEAKQYREKFNREHPNHPAVPLAVVEQGDYLLERAIAHLRVGDRATEPASKQAAYDRATKTFAGARQYFEQALGMSLDAENAPPTPDAPMRRVWGEARTKLALIEYWLASMLSDSPGTAPPQPAPAESEEEAPAKVPMTARQAGFLAVALQLATIAAECRGESAGIVAQYWQGRALAEAGDNENALEMLDETLSFAPEPDEEPQNRREAAFFAEVTLLRLQLLRKQNRNPEILTEATSWLDAREKRPEAPGFHAISLELAKAKLAAAELELGPRRRTARKSALVYLANIAQAPGSQQLEALQLLRIERKVDNDALEPAQEIEELLALAAEEERNLMWLEAEKHLADALAAQEKLGTGQKLADTRENLSRLQLRRTRWLAGQGELLAAVTLAEQVLDQAADTSSAPAIAAIGTNAAARLLSNAAAEEQPEIHARLVRLAEQIRSRWPERVEADDAQIALGLAEAVLGQQDSALQRFESIAKNSSRFRQAQYQAGKLLWRQAAASSEKDSDAPPADEKQRLVERAKVCLTNAIPVEGDPASIVEPRDARPLLAEVCLAQRDAVAALEWLAPVVSGGMSANSSDIDHTLLRGMHAAVRAHVVLGQYDEARAIVFALEQVTPDTAEFNRIVLDMLRMSVRDLLADKSADEDTASGRTAPRDLPAANSQVDEMINSLAAREHLGPQEQLLLGDLCMFRGAHDQAAELYKALIDAAQTDPAFAAQSAQQLARARTRLVQLLRERGEYSRAIAETDILLKEHPRSLAIALERGRILEAWSRTDLSQVDAALKQWNDIRVALGKQTPRPAEYFEAVYSVALCLRRQAIVKKSPDDLAQARKLLDATLILSPKLSGPAMVAQYKKLLDDISRDRITPGK
ncbi:MAG: hypothetical protein KF708_19325 [Pirellulales bacterium]|nr:hypothetical protein [Pirellulales bacterium]